MVFKTGDEHNLSTGKAVSTGRLQPVEEKAVTDKIHHNYQTFCSLTSISHVDQCMLGIVVDHYPIQNI